MQVASGERDRMAGTEGDVLIDAAVLAEGNLAFGSAVELIKNRPRQATLGEGAEIRDVDDVGRGDGARGWSHALMPKRRVQKAG